MRVLVTGSSGHLGEALVRRLRDLGHEVVSLDIREGPFTTRLSGSPRGNWLNRQRKAWRGSTQRSRRIEVFADTLANPDTDHPNKEGGLYGVPRSLRNIGTP